MGESKLGTALQRAVRGLVLLAPLRPHLLSRAFSRDSIISDWLLASHRWDSSTLSSTRTHLVSRMSQLAVTTHPSPGITRGASLLSVDGIPSLALARPTSKPLLS